MAVTTQITRQAPWMEDYIKALYTDAQSQVKKDAGQFPPAYQIAGLSPLETQAGGVLQGGIGSWSPYLSEAQGGVRAGTGAISEAALPMMQAGYGAVGQAQELAGMTRGIPYQYRDQGIGALTGAMGGFDPSTISDFYDPYAEDVIATQQADIERLGQQQRMAANARAAAAGAFGGSRGAVEQAEIGRNVLGEQSRMGAQLRSQGYQQAQQAAQQAFEAQQGRQIAAGTGIGQLGLQYGQLGQQDVSQLAALGQARGQLGQGVGALGTGLGALGMQQAQLGEGTQRMNLADVNAMMQLGGTYRTQQQAELEALRRSQAQAQMYPYQQYGYLADLFKSSPSGTYSMLTEPTAPAPSPFQQVAGLGIGALGAMAGAKYAGLA